MGCFIEERLEYNQYINGLFITIYINIFSKFIAGFGYMINFVFIFKTRTLSKRNTMDMESCCSRVSMQF